MRRTDTAGGQASAVPAAAPPTGAMQLDFPDCTGAVDCPEHPGRHNQTCPRTALTDAEIETYVDPDPDELVVRHRLLIET